MSFFDRIREKVKDTPIHELLEEILRETGYLDFVTAMPAGNSRRANLEKLIDQAVAYERSSYKGLFHFVRYIEHLQKYEVDFGAAEMLSENDDAVRLMSIHKSKGLEFPVVFVSGLGRQFNRQDSRGQMILHSEYGAGLEYADPKKRVKKTTLYKKAVSDAISMETLGEEMRVLYVALTRAKEKLVLTRRVQRQCKTGRMEKEPRDAPAFYGAAERILLPGVGGSKHQFAGGEIYPDPLSSLRFGGGGAGTGKRAVKET